MLIEFLVGLAYFQTRLEPGRFFVTVKFSPSIRDEHTRVQKKPDFSTLELNMQRNSLRMEELVQKLHVQKWLSKVRDLISKCVSYDNMCIHMII